MKPVIHSVASWEHSNIRTWIPDNPEWVAVELMLDIGPKGERASDSFSIRVATPQGLLQLSARDGIIATRPLLVMSRYDYDDLWRWLQGTVSACDGNTWPECVEKLRIHFLWEYESEYQMMRNNPNTQG